MAAAASHSAVRAWLFTACLMLAVAILSAPVGPVAQLTFTGLALALMALVAAFAPAGLAARMAVVSLGGVIVIRYVVWRFTETLPPLSEPVSFALGLLLALAEAYCVAILGIGLVINAKPLDRPAATPPLPEDAPTVDVLIPTYNEDEYILATTVAAAKAMDYPAGKLTVWLLDDGGTDQKCNDPDPKRAKAAQERRAALQAMCEALSVRYVTRAKNEHAKAGNLNAGLAASSGELVVVFDADHAPFRSFLVETVGLFAADPKLFLVQTPHVFLNPDPIERNLRTFHRMPSENEMFYATTQRGLDNWNGSFFCGSAAVMSRRALVSAGGFSGVTITEDCETAFELHARGWTSAYVAKPLIAGLQPETFGSFIGQRSRWCQGMMQIMILKNPLAKAGLSPIQRLSYLSSMTFWLFPVPRLIFMLAPLLHIFLDVKIFVSTLEEALAYTATYVLANLILQNYLHGKVRWPWVSELYEYVQGVYLLDALFSVIASPRKPTFNVTAKGVSLDRDHVSDLARPYFLIFFALAAGVATAAWRWAFEPGVTDLMLIVGGWCLFNLVIAGAAIGVVVERRQTERTPSLGVERRGIIRAGDAIFRVEIVRASATGCVVKDDLGLRLALADKTAHLAVQDLRPGVRTPLLQVRAAAWNRQGEDLALDYVDPSHEAYETISDLVYGDPGAIERFLRSRRTHKDVVSGTLRFAFWGLLGPCRGVAQIIRDAVARYRVAKPAPVEAAVPAPDRAPTPEREFEGQLEAFREFAASLRAKEEAARPVQAPAVLQGARR